MMIDSQAVKNTCNASIVSKGYCFYKSTNGIKRHLAVEPLGFPFFTHCTKANVSDDVGLIEMLTKNMDYFKSKPVNVPKITILLDHGYHPEHLTAELKKVDPQIMTKIKFDSRKNLQKNTKKLKDNRDLCQLKRGGSSSARILGWKGVKFSSKTSREP